MTDLDLRCLVLFCHCLQDKLVNVLYKLTCKLLLWYDRPHKNVSLRPIFSSIPKCCIYRLSHSGCQEDFVSCLLMLAIVCLTHKWHFLMHVWGVCYKYYFTFREKFSIICYVSSCRWWYYVSLIGATSGAVELRRPIVNILRRAVGWKSFHSIHLGQKILMGEFCAVEHWKVYFI